MTEPRAGAKRASRRQRSDGEESQRRILDAASEIAGERGYAGATIAAVSERCGLPASSIYWHFADKDELIAAVIERSFTTWLSSVQLPDGLTATDPKAVLDTVRGVAAGVAKALLDSPDFLRLGLLLTLERRPVEPTARTKFLQVREITRTQLVDTTRRLAPGLSEPALQQLVTYALAGADGLFVAREIGGDAVDLVALFDLHARVLTTVLAQELAAAEKGPTS